MMMLVSNTHRVRETFVQLHRKSLINNTCGHENKQQNKLKCVLISDGGNFYSQHELKHVKYILIITLLQKY